VTTAAGAAAAFMIVPRHVLGRGMQAPSDLVNIAVVGINGQGATNTQAMWSQNIVAICDVDDALMEAKFQSWKNAVAADATGGRQGGAAPAAAAAGRQDGTPPVPRWKEFGPSNGQKAADAKWTQDAMPVRRQRFVEQQLPKLKRYRDYREMLDKQKDIDGVVVEPPDGRKDLPDGAGFECIRIERPVDDDLELLRPVEPALRLQAIDWQAVVKDPHSTAKDRRTSSSCARVPDDFRSFPCPSRGRSSLIP
jgi:hypothetical protein